MSGVVFMAQAAPALNTRRKVQIVSERRIWFYFMRKTAFDKKQLYVTVPGLIEQMSETGRRMCSVLYQIQYTVHTNSYFLDATQLL